MFCQKDINQLQSSYFVMIRRVENFIEVRSKNTGHCWIIKKLDYSSTLPVIIYHKHNNRDYYHRHGQATSITHAIKDIKNHDTYVLDKKEPCRIVRTQ
jgi:hypothetical protein